MLSTVYEAYLCVMRVGLIILAGIVISVFVGMAFTRPSTTLPERELTIALRQIGHQILLHSGDKTSRVLPVKQLNKEVFQLEFQSPFTYVPDSLVRIVTSTLSGVPHLQPYMVHVLDCSSHQITYGFKIGRLEESTLIPCLGRNQPKACYQIRISFLPAEEQHGYLTYALIIGAGGLLVFGFVIARTSKQSKQKPPMVSGIRIGLFTYDPDRKLLANDAVTFELSDKENKLLGIFSAHQNEIVSREYLMKTVWEDEGVIVGRSLDVFVSKLRKKLKSDPQVQLTNVHGVGYKLEVRS